MPAIRLILFMPNHCAVVTNVCERPRNADEIQTCAETAAPLLATSGATVLAAYCPQDVLEGAAPEGVVIVTIPTMEDARAFCDGAEYQAAVRLSKRLL
ncbi:MAG: DUF1330 domain-containing protein [Rhizobium ruizarguesonis]|nr:DUF1330 domain-containing protein [Rhizobium ruizarguesonis]